MIKQVFKTDGRNFRVNTFSNIQSLRTLWKFEKIIKNLGQNPFSSTLVESFFFSVCILVKQQHHYKIETCKIDLRFGQVLELSFFFFGLFFQTCVEYFSLVVFSYFEFKNPFSFCHNAFLFYKIRYVVGTSNNLIT